MGSVEKSAFRSVVVTEKILDFVHDALCPHEIHLRGWITNKKEFIVPIGLANKLELNELSDGSVVCRETNLEENPHFGVILDGMVVEFGELNGRGAVYINHLDNSTEWSLCQFSCSKGKLDKLREFTIFGEGVYPTDVDYHPVEFNSLHFVCLLGED